MKSVSSQGYTTVVQELSKPPLKASTFKPFRGRFEPPRPVTSRIYPRVRGRNFVRDRTCQSYTRLTIFTKTLSMLPDWCIMSRQWDGRSESGRFLFEGALKLKWAVYMICLLLFIAAVDTIPDPPAINPPSSHSSAISGIHFRNPTTLLEKEWFVTASSPRCFQVSWFSSRLAFENTTLGVCPTPLIQHAADPSPPAIS